MDNTGKTELFETSPIPKAVLTLSIPLVISSLVMMIYNLADTYFVGLLNDSIQTAAVTLASPVLLAFNAVNNLFGVGGSSMMSRALGKRDYETVKKSAAVSFYCALLFGVVFSVLYTAFRSPLLTVLGADSDTLESTSRYLMWTTTCGAAPAILNVVMGQIVRSEGDSLHASIGIISGCVLNIILDPLFILPSGLNMGAAGAGCATFLSNCVACIYFFLLIFIKKKKNTTYIAVNPRLLAGSKEILSGICAVGIPAAIQNLLNVTGMTVLNNFMSAYGSDAVAAIGIAQKVNMIPLYVAMGMGQGIMPLIGYNYSSGNGKRMKQALRFTLILVMIFMLAIMAVFLAGAPGIIRLFMESETVVLYGSSFLRGMCIAQPFLCIDFLAVGVFQACGMGRKSLIFAIMRKIVLEIPALIILNKLFPMYGLAYAQFCAEFVLAIIAAVVLLRLFRKLDQEQGQ